MSRTTATPAARLAAIASSTAACLRLLISRGHTGWRSSVAAVAAETPELADDAARAVVVEYEELPWSITPEQALEPGAAEVRRKGNLGRVRESGDSEAADAALAEIGDLGQVLRGLPGGWRCAEIAPLAIRKRRLGVGPAHRRHRAQRLGARYPRQHNKPHPPRRAARYIAPWQLLRATGGARRGCN